MKVKFCFTVCLVIAQFNVMFNLQAFHSQDVITRKGPDYFKGELAPDFSLNDSVDKMHSLKDYSGKKVILCFFEYERLDEFQSNVEKVDILRQLHVLQDTYAQLQKYNFEVVAITPSSKKILETFNRTYRFPFVLLSDKDRRVALSYGVTEFGLVARSTLIIDERGVVVNVILSDEASDHLTEIFFYVLQQVGMPLQKNEKREQFS